MTLTSVMASGAERARLATLRSYAILDTSSESEFDAIVGQAAKIFGATTAAITLVDESRCWFKARLGLDAIQTPRDFSFCGQAFGSSGTFVVPDALKDARFKNLPLVTGTAGFRFYVGAPLRAPDGNSIGTLCVLDRAPNEPTAGQLARLGELAGEVMALLEARRDAATPAPPISVAPDLSDNLVLVADDEESVREFTSAVLKHLGYQVFSVANGADALVRIAELRGRVRLVVTDLSMPVMGGLDLVRALRRQPHPPAVVVMSGHFDQQNRTALKAEGVVCMLGKPFSMDELQLALLQAQAARA
jgi:CheY-like chemotaxis protein